MDFDNFVELSDKSSTSLKLEDILNKINKDGFDLLDTSDYIFLIKAYIGKILEIYDNKYDTDKNVAKEYLKTLVRNTGINLSDYSNNNYSTIGKESKEVAKKVIKIYKDYNN